MSTPPPATRHPPLILGIDASRANTAERTGTEWYAFHLIQEFKKIIPSDVRVILYSREPLRADLRADWPPNWEERVLSWPPRRLWTQVRLSWEMWRRPPDLLFVPVHALPLVLPAKAAVTLHDVAFVVEPAAYSRFENWYQRFAVNFAAKRATGIITISDFSRAELIKYFSVSAEKMSVTLLGLDTAAFRPPTEPAETKAVLAGLKIERPYFLYVGRLERKKNIVGLLLAFQEFKRQAGAVDQTALVLVGKFGHGSGEILTLLATDAGLAADVIRPGYVGKEALPHLYAGAEAFVFPSWYEGFGLPMLEAFSVGTPVIAARAASLPEVAGEAALYGDPTRPTTFAAAMWRLRQEPELRKSLIAKGLARAREFTWRKTAEKTWEVLRSL